MLYYLCIRIGPYDHEAPYLNNDIDHSKCIGPPLHTFESIFDKKHRRVHLDNEPLEVRYLRLILLGLQAGWVTMLQLHTLDTDIKNQVGSMLLNRHVPPYRKNCQQINDKLHQILSNININIAEGLLGQA